MKKLLIGVLVSSLLLNIYFGIVASKRTQEHERYATGDRTSFTITNLNGSASGDGYVVVYLGGKSWWTIDGEILSVNAGVDQEMTIRLDKETGRAKSTTIELFDGSGRHCYFTDMNADGIPDKKRVAGESDYQIFYNGQFVSSFAEADSRSISINGTNLPVKFDGTRWRVVE